MRFRVCCVPASLSTHSGPGRTAASRCPTVKQIHSDTSHQCCRSISICEPRHPTRPGLARPFVTRFPRGADGTAGQPQCTYIYAKHLNSLNGGWHASKEAHMCTGTPRDMPRMPGALRLEPELQFPAHYFKPSQRCAPIKSSKNVKAGCSPRAPASIHQGTPAPWRP